MNILYRKLNHILVKNVVLTNQTAIGKVKGKQELKIKLFIIKMRSDIV